MWIPLIALFSGARLEEIGQLLCTDVRIEEGIDYFNLLDLPNEDEHDEDGGHVKKLKTLDAGRRVPIHPELVAMGFLDYVATVPLARKEEFVPGP